MSTNPRNQHSLDSLVQSLQRQSTPRLVMLQPRIDQRSILAAPVPVRQSPNAQNMATKCSDYTTVPLIDLTSSKPADMDRSETEDENRNKYRYSPRSILAPPTPKSDTNYRHLKCLDTNVDSCNQSMTAHRSTSTSQPQISQMYVKPETVCRGTHVTTMAAIENKFTSTNRSISEKTCTQNFSQQSFGYKQSVPTIEAPLSHNVKHEQRVHPTSVTQEKCDQKKLIPTQLTVQLKQEHSDQQSTASGSGNNQRKFIAYCSSERIMKLKRMFSAVKQAKLNRQQNKVPVVSFASIQSKSSSGNRSVQPTESVSGAKASQLSSLILKSQTPVVSAQKGILSKPNGSIPLNEAKFQKQMSSKIVPKVVQKLSTSLQSSNSRRYAVFKPKVNFRKRKYKKQSFKRSATKMKVPKSLSVPISSSVSIDGDESRYPSTAELWKKSYLQYVDQKQLLPLSDLLKMDLTITDKVTGSPFTDKHEVVGDFQDIDADCMKSMSESENESVFETENSSFDDCDSQSIYNEMNEYLDGNTEIPRIGLSKFDPFNKRS